VRFTPQSMRSASRTGRPGFTLVELMIVVVILGILAAVVIPQISEATTATQLSSLRENLAIIRKQISLYRLQHGDYPDIGSFAAQMTQRTDRDGTPNSSGAYGPYLVSIPVNPFTMGGSGNDVSSDPAGIDKAWYYEEATGLFLANDGGITKGVTHDSL